ncbi:hypothetical protein [Nocardia gipuzkoensis]|uniref:hypothetical protein n=1 Tax=Nocardia gipuzkoensis TaxID=2749991 RepID=UPI003EDF2E34
MGHARDEQSHRALSGGALRAEAGSVPYSLLQQGLWMAMRSSWRTCAAAIATTLKPEWRA